MNKNPTCLPPASGWLRVLWTPNRWSRGGECLGQLAPEQVDNPEVLYVARRIAEGEEHYEEATSLLKAASSKRILPTWWPVTTWPGAISVLGGRGLGQQISGPVRSHRKRPQALLASPTKRRTPWYQSGSVLRAGRSLFTPGNHRSRLALAGKTSLHHSNDKYWPAHEALLHFYRAWAPRVRKRLLTIVSAWPAVRRRHEFIEPPRHQGRQNQKERNLTDG